MTEAGLESERSDEDLSKPGEPGSQTESGTNTQPHIAPSFRETQEERGERRGEGGRQELEERREGREGKDSRWWRKRRRSTRL